MRHAFERVEGGAGVVHAIRSPTQVDEPAKAASHIAIIG
jgi:hypothetical protein